MDIIEAIKKRRSIRKFQDKPVPRELLEKIIEAATYAPSACNLQGWRFIIIDNQSLKEKIIDSGGSILIKNSPTGILALYDKRTKNFEYKDYLQSASAAIENLLLAATSLDMGTCWICHLPSKRQLKKLLNIPNYFSPIAYILVGYPENQPNPVRRKYSPAEVMNYNEFSKNWPKEKINFFVVLIKKIMIKIYYLTPKIIKTKFLNKLIDKYFVKKFDN